MLTEFFNTLIFGLFCPKLKIANRIIYVDNFNLHIHGQEKNQKT